MASQKSACTATTQNFSVSESGYSGAFTATSLDTTIVSVAATANVANTFTVTSVTTVDASHTMIKVTDTAGNSGSIFAGTSICLP